jgi:hypothetical protein
MNKRQERALEVFLYVTFAIALFAGVGNTKSDTSIFPVNFEFTKGQSDAVHGFQNTLPNDDPQQDIELQSRINFFGNNDKVNALGRGELFKGSQSQSALDLKYYCSCTEPRLGGFPSCTERETGKTSA